MLPITLIRSQLKCLAGQPFVLQQPFASTLGQKLSERIRSLIEGRGCTLLYLPPYSPDLNPIEVAFSKNQQLLRAIRAQNEV
jgi:hypothetical protein